MLPGSARTLSRVARSAPGNLVTTPRCLPSTGRGEAHRGNEGRSATSCGRGCARRIGRGALSPRVGARQGVAHVAVSLKPARSRHWPAHSPRFHVRADSSLYSLRSSYANALTVQYLRRLDWHSLASASLELRLAECAFPGVRLHASVLFGLWCSALCQHARGPPQDRRARSVAARGRPAIGAPPSGPKSTRSTGVSQSD